MPDDTVRDGEGGGKAALVLVDANAVAAARDWLFRLCDADDPDECYSVAMVVEALEKATAAPDYAAMAEALRANMSLLSAFVGPEDEIGQAALGLGRAALALAEGGRG